MAAGTIKEGISDGSRLARPGLSPAADLSRHVPGQSHQWIVVSPLVARACQARGTTKDVVRDWWSQDVLCARTLARDAIILVGSLSESIKCNRRNKNERYWHLLSPSIPLCARSTGVDYQGSTCVFLINILIQFDEA